jgi:hypothetical protein
MSFVKQPFGLLKHRTGLGPFAVRHFKHGLSMGPWQDHSAAREHRVAGIHEEAQITGNEDSFLRTYGAEWTRHLEELRSN